MASPIFFKVLQDNITACHQAGYLNKAKLFQFLQQTIQTEAESYQESKQPPVESDTEEEEDITGAKYGLNVYHAPQFVEENNREAFEHVEVGYSNSPPISIGFFGG